MRKLYNEFFYVPKHGKIREKTMTARVITTTITIIICLMAMSFSAYAFFTYNVTSGISPIKSASFYTDVTVQIKDSNGKNIDVVTSDYISHIARNLKANETYFVTLRHTERSTAKTGFVIVTAENCDEIYHTQQLGKDENGITQQLTFKITPSSDTNVIFKSYWGTSSYYPALMNIGINDDQYIVQNEEINMIIIHDEETTSENEIGNTDSPTDETTPTIETTTTETIDTTDSTTEASKYSEE